jgi:hypothetical protein
MSYRLAPGHMVQSICSFTLCPTYLELIGSSLSSVPSLWLSVSLVQSSLLSLPELWPQAKLQCQTPIDTTPVTQLKQDSSSSLVKLCNKENKVTAPGSPQLVEEASILLKALLCK